MLYEFQVYSVMIRYFVVYAQFNVIKYWPYSLCRVMLFSCTVESDSLPPHGLQHAKLPCHS